ncbi:MAG TPA: hypothetical protein VHZ50_06580, partial [Puia sp.]|nr:hypothetical protein [Puia sp.]
LKGYKKYFQEKENPLPPHQPWDLAIEFMPDKTPKPVPIYPLSRDEEEEQIRSLEENLRKGFIRESKLLIRYLTIYIPKKDGIIR